MQNPSLDGTQLDQETVNGILTYVNKWSQISTAWTPVNEWYQSHGDGKSSSKGVYTTSTLCNEANERHALIRMNGTPILQVKVPSPGTHLQVKQAYVEALNKRLDTIAADKAKVEVQRKKMMFAYQNCEACSPCQLCAIIVRLQ